jgi:hypothetical protein
MAKRPRSKKNDDEAEHGLPSLALVFGYIAVKELQSTEDRVKVLTRLGYGNQEMAMICDSTPGAIAVMKHRATKRKANR